MAFPPTVVKSRLPVTESHTIKVDRAVSPSECPVRRGSSGRWPRIADDCFDIGRFAREPLPASAVAPDFNKGSARYGT